MLSKRNQTQKATYCIILLIWYSEKAKLSEVNTDQWMPGTGLGEGLTIKGYEDNFRDDGYGDFMAMHLPKFSECA